jgi:CBS domain-containing protein
MICPHCGEDNLPGSEECARCWQDLTQLDLPVAQNRVERSLMEDPVSALRPREPVTVRPTTTVCQAIQIMLARDIGSVLVVDQDAKLLGIFSERDLLTKVAGLAEPHGASTVRDFMTPNPETVTSADPLAFALHKMDGGGYRHLPVISGGRPTGVISVRDLLRHITRLCKSQ